MNSLSLDYLDKCKYIIYTAFVLLKRWPVQKFNSNSLSLVDLVSEEGGTINRIWGFCCLGLLQRYYLDNIFYLAVARIIQYDPLANKQGPRL
jgi:hypothetical protein